MRESNLVSLELIHQLNTILLVGIALVVITTLIIKSRKVARHFFEEELSEELERSVNTYLISSTENEGVRKESVDRYHIEFLNDRLKGNLRKGLFMRYLLSLRKNLSGEFDEALLQLYLRLGLFKLSLRKLKSWSWPIRLRGVAEIGEFRHKQAKPLIEKALKSRNRVVRQEAQMSYIRLSSEKPLSFLQNGKDDLTHWQQLRIYHVLRHLEVNRTINYELHLSNANDKVKAYLVQLCVLFQRIDAMEYIRPLLAAGDEVKIWVLRAITEMGDERDAVEVIKLLSTSENKYVQIECLKAMRAVSMPDDLEALVPILLNGDPELKLIALGTIESLSGDIKSFIDSHPELEMTDELISMTRHIQEPLNN